MRLTERESRIRAQAFKEAAEIARYKQRMEHALAERLGEELGENHEATAAFRERHTAVRLVAEAIEAAAKGGQK